MATVAAARYFLRSSAAKSSARSGASKFSAGGASKPKSNPFSQSPFQLPKQKSLSSRCIFRSPVELSCCVESLMPYHTATASALLTSMLSDACRHCWTSEDG